MRSLRQLSILLLALSVGLGGLVLSPQSSFTNEAQAQNRREQRKQKVLDYKAFERDKNREAYGELANQKRQEAITQLKSILSQQERLPADTKAEMLMRLAELYFEQSKYEYNTEMQAYEKKFDACFNDPKCDATTLDPDNVVSQKWQQKSIKLYRQILFGETGDGESNSELIVADLFDVVWRVALRLHL